MPIDSTNHSSDVSRNVSLKIHTNKVRVVHALRK